ncbi:hypothetical protein [Paracoccus methylarcula]|uniref:hypothetical protein n=1 Tax=Paracoccus methylarcula TaxID=72022 RepID=UPI0024822753|nr:hypothetical protein [Paracoccus methylarcula]
MTKVALFGAGGKMGLRLSSNLAKTDFETCHVEVSEDGAPDCGRRWGWNASIRKPRWRVPRWSFSRFPTR